MTTSAHLPDISVSPKALIVVNQIMLDLTWYLWSNSVKAETFLCYFFLFCSYSSHFKYRNVIGRIPVLRLFANIGFLWLFLWSYWWSSWWWYCSFFWKKGSLTRRRVSFMRSFGVSLSNCPKRFYLGSSHPSPKLFMLRLGCLEDLCNLIMKCFDHVNSLTLSMPRLARDEDS